MDVAEFFRERQRICDTFERCEECPLYVSSGCNTPSNDKEINELVEAIEKWSEEHPLIINRR